MGLGHGMANEGGIDGPTVAGTAADVQMTDEDADPTGPAMPSGQIPLSHPLRNYPRKRVPWREDTRCDPSSRFFEPPNLDHLVNAEEV